MPLPIVYPRVIGPGRLTEIASFRKSNIGDDEYRKTLNDIMEEVRGFPISLQNILGYQVEDSQIAVLIADWKSAEEKDEFEPGERYQSVKPRFGKLIDFSNMQFAWQDLKLPLTKPQASLTLPSHHLILPGASRTPDCSFFTVSHMVVPIEKQDEAARAFEDYVSSVAVDEKTKFVAVAASREDPEVVVCLTGHRDAEACEVASSAATHKQLKASLDRIVRTGGEYSITTQLVHQL